MPKRKASAASSEKPVETEKPVEMEVEEEESEEEIDLNREAKSDDSEYEEEIDLNKDAKSDDSSEYEEVEEEEEVEVEEDEKEEETGNADESASHSNSSVDEETAQADDTESQKHAELLSLPPHGAEVYVGGIPHDASEEDLRSFCESVGEVVEVRIMKGRDSVENKGYAFVMFKTKELASKAIQELNNAEFKDKKIKCSTSQVKNRLFIGNIPKSWGDEDLEKVVAKVGPGINAVELVKDPQNSSRNRGFAFIEYYNHACAEYARQKMSNAEFKLDSNAPTVSWADSKNADSASTSQVKAVYVKNLPKDISQDKLRKLFKHHGEIQKVVLPTTKSGKDQNRIGFVHFSERSSAMKALKNTEKYEIDGHVLECALAKPQSDRASDSGSNLQKQALLPSYPPRSYAYGAAGFPQTLTTAAGMPMMPMLLPDGRIAYVMPQPGAQSHSPAQHQRNGSSGGKSSGRQGSHNNSQGRRYRPY